MKTAANWRAERAAVEEVGKWPAASLSSPSRSSKQQKTRNESRKHGSKRPRRFSWWRHCSTSFSRDIIFQVWEPSLSLCTSRYHLGVHRNEWLNNRMTWKPFALYCVLYIYRDHTDCLFLCFQDNESALIMCHRSMYRITSDITAPPINTVIFELPRFFIFLLWGGGGIDGCTQ